MTNRNKQKEELSLDEQIRITRREIAILRKQKREQKLAEEKELKKNPIKRGRKKLDEKIIQEAWKLAETKSLPDVALKLDIALRTLYNYGINRKAVNKRIKLRENFEPKLEVIKTFCYMVDKILEKARIK